jgi:hypothetical protein
LFSYLTTCFAKASPVSSRKSYCIEDAIYSGRLTPDCTALHPRIYNPS